jgi:hypothetical protein
LNTIPNLGAGWVLPNADILVQVMAITIVEPKHRASPPGRPSKARTADICHPYMRERERDRGGREREREGGGREREGGKRGGHTHTHTHTHPERERERERERVRERAREIEGTGPAYWVA